MKCSTKLRVLSILLVSVVGMTLVGRPLVSWLLVDWSTPVVGGERFNKGNHEAPAAAGLHRAVLDALSGGLPNDEPPYDEPGDDELAERGWCGASWEEFPRQARTAACANVLMLKSALNMADGMLWGDFKEQLDALGVRDDIVLLLKTSGQRWNRVSFFRNHFRRMDGGSATGFPCVSCVSQGRRGTMVVRLVGEVSDIATEKIPLGNRVALERLVGNQLPRHSGGARGFLPSRTRCMVTRSFGAMAETALVVQVAALAQTPGLSTLAKAVLNVKMKIGRLGDYYCDVFGQWERFGNLIYEYDVGWAPYVTEILDDTAQNLRSDVQIGDALRMALSGASSGASLDDEIERAVLACTGPVEDLTMSCAQAVVKFVEEAAAKP